MLVLTTRPRPRRRNLFVDILLLVLQIVVVITSALTVLLVLMHRGKGGGLSDMFGGGISSGAGSSGVAEKNLNRLTVTVGVVWGLAIVGIAVLSRFMMQ
jgi:preprotein translocase subunit SecG